MEVHHGCRVVVVVVVVVGVRSPILGFQRSIRWKPTRPRVDSTQLKGCVRPQTFVDRHETFVTVCFETVHECLWTLERLEVSKRAFRGPGGKRPRSFWDPELIRLNSKGCVRSWTVTNVCDRPRMFVDHPRMFVDRPRTFRDRRAHTASGCCSAPTRGPTRRAGCT